MALKHRHEQIPYLARDQWDSELARADAQEAFQKVLDCTTLALQPRCTPHGVERSKSFPMPRSLSDDS